MLSPLALLGIGMVVVIGGILWLRLHAFLALILAAFLVAALTPRSAVRDTGVGDAAVKVDAARDEGGFWLAPTSKQKLIEGRNLVYRDRDFGEGAEVGEGVLKALDAELPEGEDRVAYAFEGAGDLVLGPDDRLIHHTQVAAATGVSKMMFAKRVAAGFGNMCVKIGILIAMAAIVGKCLMDSGAAERIVVALGRLFGERGQPVAFAGSGFALGIPVFFDTVFYLMMPLGKALHVKTKKNYLLYVLSIVAGGTMAHSLVPPTPGPLLVVEALDLDLGLAIVAGLAVGSVTVTVGLIWALIANKIWTVPLRPSAELPEEDLAKMAERDPSELPPLFPSILPILLPVLMMAFGTAYKEAVNQLGSEAPGWLIAMKPSVELIGDKNIALTVAALVGLMLLARYAGRNRKEIATAVGGALAGGATIILITAAGGAFGGVLQQTGIATTIEALMEQWKIGIIPLSFVVCLVIRTAQGSATVAMITTVGIIAPIVVALEAAGTLGFHPIYVALAIGCGSKPISWMNDSGFWVISKMSGLTEGEMLKANTVMGCLMAAAGLGVCLLGARYLPMV